MPAPVLAEPTGRHRAVEWCPRSLRLLRLLADTAHVARTVTGDVARHPISAETPVRREDAVLVVADAPPFSIGEEARGEPRPQVFRLVGGVVVSGEHDQLGQPCSELV